MPLDDVLSLRKPERDVLLAFGVLGVRLEGDDSFLCRELTGETRVLGPEETNVGDGEEDHGESFETESEGPTLLLRDAWKETKENRSQFR